ncbi:geranylgeranylglyceryl/heptaprenylglyceryl phosphate synthase [Ascidiimonas aurantiaca]|uniref:geranylgeranylglyceryl/heptaprenylglyceryl phosphate synthase n=1 Tax=Ascidiimonas aurantiaca TaxID=1685432 RepID=UPI0030ED3211
MNAVYENILEAVSAGEKLLAVLIDPEKTTPHQVPFLFENIQHTPVTHVFLGGSEVEKGKTDILVKVLKENTNLPVVLFPGCENQISENADALLFLSLLSGRNPEYLIGKQVQSVPRLHKTRLEIIPTAYLLIDGGKKTSVQRVSKTEPIKPSSVDEIVHTALAGQFLGMKLIYLEAGSGALQSVPQQVVREVKKNTNLPLIVGGGIRTVTGITSAYRAGADIVVIGTAFENNPHFFNQLKTVRSS